MNHHIAVYINNKNNKEHLIDCIQTGDFIYDFSELNGVLFSEITLNKFISEERIHGHYEVFTDTKNTLEHASSGERKKALLKYLIAQNPEYIIVDNVFGNLDVAAQKDIINQISDLAACIPVIQITNRKQEILPIVNKVYQIKEDNTLVLFDSSFNTVASSNTNFINALPQDYQFKKERYNPVVNFKNVSVAYHERPIINGINWEIKTGEFWQLIGPNGSGKSTMLSMIFGDNPKAYGQDIILFGRQKGSGESVWEIKKKIGYFSSDMLRGFNRRDSIGNMIVSGFFDTIGLYKTPTNQQIKIAHQWLRVLGMFDIRKQCFLTLSRGHQVLVLIARAMVKHPPLLILDEPTNGLDDFDVKIFTELVNKIALETETAILYVSHRKEQGLEPDYIYKLTPNETGSIGQVVE
ncbi:ATP-binding cassette domain-containing protein [Gaetbulibacter saemankumensis]|uniref:ATP-binding cassette domain-containing protein n=1 Tax=Gaetbulibacter saemankumensis TaxID=311208 RepID=UPI0004001473|nr:ATP-binding cassette domain-containing protein [Gaetbulibacter saemankumensis]